MFFKPVLTTANVVDSDYYKHNILTTTNVVDSDYYKHNILTTTMPVAL